MGMTAVQEERGPRKNKGQRNGKSAEKDVKRVRPSGGLLCNRDMALSSIARSSLSTPCVPFTSPGKYYRIICQINV